MLKATASFLPTSTNVASTGRETPKSFKRLESFTEEADELPFKKLTPDEAAALRLRNPSLSPWRVIAAQAALGVLIAAIAGWVTGTQAATLSALYGALVVVLPGVLMARGTTSPVSRSAPMTGAVMVMFWAVVKMGASVLMLLAAPKVIGSLSWPALLIALGANMQVYWLALLWRGR